MGGLYAETDNAVIPTLGIVHELVATGKSVEIIVYSCQILVRITLPSNAAYR